jgi:hypothetical protein
MVNGDQSELNGNIQFGTSAGTAETTHHQPGSSSTVDGTTNVDPEVLLKEKLKMSLFKKKLGASSSPTSDADLKTCHVRIDNFQRPLHTKGLLQWLCQTCEVTLKEENIWINAIKTHCYVDFSSEEDASKCVSVVTGKKFPSTNTNTLIASFTTISAKEAPASNEGNLKPQEWKGTTGIQRLSVDSSDSTVVASSSSVGKVINKNEALKRKLSEAMESNTTASTNLFKRAAVGAISNTPKKIIKSTQSTTAGTNELSALEEVKETQEHTQQLRHTQTIPSITWCPVNESVAQSRIKLFRHRMGVKVGKNI